MNSRRLQINGFLILLLLLVMMASLALGQADLSLGAVWTGLWGSADTAVTIIVQELRLPRVLLGALAGAALGVGGALLQGLLRNPLAEPGIIGVTSMAGLGAVIAIYLGLASLSSLAIPLSAMLGAFIAAAIILFLAGRDASILTIILAGLGISSFATAMLSLVMNFAPTPMSLQDMVLWMLGSLENRTTEDLMLAAPFVLLGWLIMVGTGRGLNALALGEDTAISLGVNMKNLRQRITAGVALSVGAIVAVCGGIGFVGLIMPHVMRKLVGHTPQAIILPSALGGAILVLLADIMTRLPVGQGQLRLGVVTAMIGAPLFVYIVFKTREQMR